MGFRGYPFTWTNRRGGDQAIQERLDRFLKTVEWDVMFPNAVVTHLTRIASDHCPIILDSEGIRHRGKRPFRFEAMWIKDEACRSVVESAWNLQSRNGRITVMEKINSCAQRLIKWNSEEFGHVGNRLKKLENELLEWDSRTGAAAKPEERTKIENQVFVLQEKEIMWSQRAKSLWLREGDINTKFFHGKANSRRKTNTILKLKDRDGRICTNDEDISSIVMDYFQDIFSSCQPNVDLLPEECIQCKISAGNKACLEKPYVAEEVLEALKQFESLKSPGPDGLPALFYKKFWDVIGKEVSDTVLEVLNGGPFPSGMNHTFITLIPKVKNPESMKDLRPISLCNVIYKLVSKCIANRLKNVLDSIIDCSQSVFVPGRLITDNALIAFEAFHSMKYNLSAKKGSCALKLDMSKAYDPVEWPFIVRLLRLMEFPCSFITLFKIASVQLLFLSL